MKKSLLLLAAACLGTAAFAQEQESAFMDVQALSIGKDYVDVEAGTVFCESPSIVMKAAAADKYRTVSLTAAADTVNQIGVNGKIYDMPDGIQGNTNPGPEANLNAPQTQGAIFQFEVKADGYLYVFSKLTNNKQYYVWAGDGGLFNAATPMIGYSVAVFSPTSGEKFEYTMPSDADGVFAAEGKLSDSSFEPYTTISYSRTYLYLDEKKTKITWADYEADKEGIKAQVDEYLAANSLTLFPKDGTGADKYLTTDVKEAGKAVAYAYDCHKAYAGSTNWTGNATGVVAFPVQTGIVYNFNATGSKVTCNGFAFAPGATEFGAVTATKHADTPIRNITMDDLDANAPVYNVQGQRVGKDFKGICIQNGQKFIVK